MVTVRIPTVLRKLTEGRPELTTPGENVAAVLTSIGKRYPAFLKRITTEAGEVQPFLNVFVNGDDIRFARDLETPVTQGDEISFIPSVAGGWDSSRRVPDRGDNEVDHALIPEAVLERIQERASADYPEECCGLLIGTRDRDEVIVLREVACSNVASKDERRRRFLIEPAMVLEVTKALRGTSQELVGFYHSHPDAEARPSSTDLAFLELWPETVWLIVPTSGRGAGRERAWWLPSGETGVAGLGELIVRTISHDGVGAPERLAVSDGGGTRSTG